MNPYRFLMLRQRGMNDAAIEEDFGRVGDGIEFLQSLDILLVVVVAKGGHPRLNFLPRMVSNCTRQVRIDGSGSTYLLQRHGEVLL
jgi:hypothetical protein